MTTAIERHNIHILKNKIENATYDLDRELVVAKNVLKNELIDEAINELLEVIEIKHVSDTQKQLVAWRLRTMVIDINDI